MGRIFKNWALDELMYGIVFPMHIYPQLEKNHLYNVFAQLSLNWMAVHLSETAMKRIGSLPALSRPDMDPSQVKRSNASDNP